MAGVDKSRTRRGRVRTLPQKSGEEVLVELLTLDPDVKIAIVSGRPVAEGTFPAVRCVIPKPSNLQTLIGRIQDLFKEESRLGVV